MGDLRERLAAVMDAAVGSLDPYRTSQRQIRAAVEAHTDEVLSAVAAWLRDEASAHRERGERLLSSTERTILVVRADTLDKAADSITGDTHG
jgi:hypothetical protein